MRMNTFSFLVWSAGFPSGFWRVSAARSEDMEVRAYAARARLVLRNDVVFMIEFYGDERLGSLDLREVNSLMTDVAF
jgi:hypothetical protein